MSVAPALFPDMAWQPVDVTQIDSFLYNWRNLALRRQASDRGELESSTYEYGDISLRELSDHLI